MLKRVLSVALVVTSFLLAANVQAADEPSAPEKGACREDLKKFCANVQPGGGRLAHCLKAHEPNLSPGCQEARRAAREKAKARAKEIRAACEGDAQKFCADVQPGGGRIHACLKKNQDQLSEACRVTLPKRGVAPKKPAEG
jgi:hypothetical protein